MKVIESSENLNPKAIYNLTKSPKTRKISEAVGQVLTVDKWVIYEDADKKTGEARELLAIDTGAEVFATNSPTFIESFRSGRELFVQYGADVKTIEVISGTSKNGRNYMDCVVSD